MTCYHDSSHEDIDNLVHSIARNYAKRFGLDWGVHGLDLVQTGWVGAMRASGRYEARGWKFCTYAYYFIAGDIRRACTALAYQRHVTATLDEVHDTSQSEDPDFAAALRELLKTSDGLELLAAELGYRRASKTGVRVRREQLDRLRARYESLRETV